MFFYHKKFLRRLHHFFICLILSLIIHGVFNDELAYANTESNRVYDLAGLLSEEEIKDLQALSIESEEETGVEFFILTHNDSNSTYPEKYIEDFEDQLYVADRVYFLYDVYRGEIFMESYGLPEKYIHSKRIYKIFDSVEDYIRNEAFYDAFATYINQSVSYMKDSSDLNHDLNYDKRGKGFDSDNEYDYDSYYKEDQSKIENIFFNIWFQLVASLIIGGITVSALAYNSGGNMSVGGRDYLDRSRKGLIGRRDQFIRSTVTRVRKPSQNTSGGSRGGYNAGGFRGGRSSGGRSHSSGGRKL